MTNVVKINSHEADAKDRLISQYRDGKNFDSLIGVFGKRSQALEDALFDFYSARLNIGSAVGRQLDNIGALIGQPRLGFGDDFYRILIYSRIGINTSRGIMPDLINIAGISTGITEEQRSFTRRRVSIIARDTRNSFRHTRLDDQGKLMFEVEDDGDFFGDLESGSLNGFPITDSVDLILSGRNWRRIGLDGMPDYPPVGQEYEFNFVKEHPPANIQFFNLSNGEVAFGTSGFFPKNLRNFLIERLEGIVCLLYTSPSPRD